MLSTFRTTQWVPYPVELVFAFFANPNNLPHLTQRWQHARLENLHLVPAPPRPTAASPSHRFQSVAAGVGSELRISMRLAPAVPLRTSWLVRIREFEWNDHFQDELVKGPFAAWRHTHRIVREQQPNPDLPNPGLPNSDLPTPDRPNPALPNPGQVTPAEPGANETILDGTRITDELEYELPLGPLGALAHAIFVRRQIESTFAFRQQKLLEILPVAARQATRRQ